IDAVLSMQAPLTRLIERCPGRTWSQRRHVFLRLQRVRNFLRDHCDRPIDNRQMASMASYSPCTFLRTFRATYEQTPHAYLVDQRLQLARQLLRTSRLGVAETAQAIGFADRCAFSRSFRRRFGMSARALRLRAHGRAVRAGDAGPP